MEMTVGNTPKFGGTVDFSESVSQLSSAFEKMARARGDRRARSLGHPDILGALAREQNGMAFHG